MPDCKAETTYCLLSWFHMIPFAKALPPEGQRESRLLILFVDRQSPGDSGCRAKPLDILQRIGETTSAMGDQQADGLAGEIVAFQEGKHAMGMVVHQLGKATMTVSYSFMFSTRAVSSGRAFSLATTCQKRKIPDRKKAQNDNTAPASDAVYSSITGTGAFLF